MAGLPQQWRNALERDSAPGAVIPPDPLPERRLARLLAGFIASGLFYLVLPGTLLGVWNLIGISSRHSAAAVSRIWIQAHGHAQLFGWVGSFMIGISLYTLPKFRGSWIRSLAIGWAMLVLWTLAVGLRWASSVWDWHWRALWPASAAAEFAVAALLLWQCTGPAPRRTGRRDWTLTLIFAGLCGLVLTLAWQLAAVVRVTGTPLIPPHDDEVLLGLALWAFCFPVAWGFSNRFLPSFLGLRQPDVAAGRVGLVLLVSGLALGLSGLPLVGAAVVAAAVLAACWSLRVFVHAERTPKLIGVDPHYPWFTRAAFGWLLAAALLAFGANVPGMTGASRHAFTVGFLSTLILSIGPRILPAFLNSRELWSKRLMLAALVALSIGCAARVILEPLAYSGIAPAAWAVLPISAFIELTAMLLFAANVGMTLISPMPAWIVARVVTDQLTVYWCITSYPETRRLLIDSGLRTLERAQPVPRTLTLREAAEAEGIDPQRIIERLREYFDKRLARSLRQPQQA